MKIKQLLSLSLLLGMLHGVGLSDAWAASTPPSSQRLAHPIAVNVWIEAVTPHDGHARALVTGSEFHLDEELVFHLRTSQPAFIYVLAQTGSGQDKRQIQALGHGTTKLSAHHWHRFPQDGAVYKLDQVRTDEQFTVIATSEPLSSDRAESLGLPWPLTMQKEQSATSDNSKKESDKGSDKGSDSKCDKRAGEKGRSPECRRILPLQQQPAAQYVMTQHADQQGVAVLQITLRPPVSENAPQPALTN